MESHRIADAVAIRVFCNGFATAGQLPTRLSIPSELVSPFGVESHASPMPSPSVSVCVGFATAGQLSALLSTPSPSVSPFGVESHASLMPSPSVSLQRICYCRAVVLPGCRYRHRPCRRSVSNHASPIPSPSVSSCNGFANRRQFVTFKLSIPSESVSHLRVVVTHHRCRRRRYRFVLDC